jgi:hypothetical protein
MGGFRVPLPAKTIKSFQWNLLQEINRQGNYNNGNSPHYAVLAGLRERANRLTLAVNTYTDNGTETMEGNRYQTETLE